MTRICVIGDSHVGAMARGWKKIAQSFPDTEIVFFAAGAATMAGLAVAGDALVAESEELRQALTRLGRPTRIGNDFHGFILCSMGFHSKSAIWLGTTHRGEDFAADARAPISNACFAAAIADAQKQTLLHATLLKVRRVSAAPLLIVATPFRSVNAEGIGGRGFDPPRDDRPLAALYRRACNSIARQFDAEFLPQPDETLGDNVMTTRCAFASEVGPRSNPDGPREDNVHMNAAYGAVVLEYALETLAADHPGMSCARRSSQDVAAAALAR